MLHSPPPPAHHTRDCPCCYTAASQNMQRFCGFYIVGNLIAVFATGLWVGPKKLCKKMFKKKRRIGVAVWFTLMIAVFTTAMLQGPLGLVLGMMAAETCGEPRVSLRLRLPCRDSALAPRRPNAPSTRPPQSSRCMVFGQLSALGAQDDP